MILLWKTKYILTVWQRILIQMSLRNLYQMISKVFYWKKVTMYTYGEKTISMEELEQMN